MSDILEIFGKEFPNVAGFKATDNNGDVLTYRREEDTISGETVYTSSTGKKYTETMIIDMDGMSPYDVLNTYGNMEHLVNLTLTGSMIANSTATVFPTGNNQFSATKFPNLKRLTLAPTSIIQGGQEINAITAGHYVFNNTNLTELVLGRFGGPYWNGGAYFRNDCPVPPGITVNSVGSTDGLHITAFVDEDMTSAGFMKDLATNTTVKLIHYETGEVIATYDGDTSGGITPTGTINITSNGTHDVTNYASANVNVSSSAPSLQAKTNINPTTSSQTITADSGYDGLSSVQINAMPSGSATTPATTITANPSISVGSDGKITATASATKSVTPTVSAGYVSAGTAGTITVSGSNTQQLTTQAAKTVTPTESEQTAVASGVYTTGVVKVGAISSTYVGSDITQRDETDLTASGATVTVPSGYYAEQETKSVATATHTNPTASVNSTTGLVTASHTQAAGYVSAGTTTGTLQLSTQAAKTITPSESSQTAVAAGKYTTGAVTVGAISSTYVGSGITQRDGDDLTASGATVTVPAGYYSAQQTKSVASGSAGTPSASKGTVSNHSVTVTPSVTNTTGYITGGTKYGTAVTVTASELVSGSQTITANGTVDVTNLASVNVALTYSTVTVSSNSPSGGNDGDIWIKQ